MINPDYAGKDYRLYHATEWYLPANTYILCSDASRKILYNPQIAGKALQERMERMAPLFIHAATEKVLRGIKLGDVVEFVLLSGGLYYFLARGFREVHGHALPQCFLGIKRERVEGSEGHFKAVATYENFESLPKNATVIIGDTIATGATIVRAINALEAAATEAKARIRNIVICSLACSSEGAKRIRGLEDRIKAVNPDFRLCLIVAEELFHLMPDGTDLRFFGDYAIMPDETKEYTAKTYGNFLASSMKCAVFDWGTRCKNPARHYAEFLEFCGAVVRDERIDIKGRKEIERMRKEALAEMEELERAL